MSAHGLEALKLDALCKSAKLTRGSFYHHFTSHKAFLVEMTQHWISLQTKHVIDQIPEDLSPDEKAARLTDLAMSLDYHLELGIRELARRNTAVAAEVRAADTERLAFLTELYAQKYRVDNRDAAFAAEIEYAAYIGTILTQPDMPKAEQRALATRFQDMLAAYFRASK